MIAGVMRLGDRPVRAVMTPRREIEMINLSEGWEGARRQMVESVHCRFPVYEKSFEEVLGVVQVKDVLDAYLLGGRPNLPAHIRSAPVVIDTIDALDVLDIIRQSSVHMALVQTNTGILRESLRAPTFWNQLSALSGQTKDLPRRMLYGAKIARGSSRALCRWTKWQSGYSFQSRNIARIIPLLVLY